GNALRDSLELAGAQEKFEDAVRIFTEDRMWIDAATPVANLCRVAIESGALSEAAKQGKAALDYLDRGLRQLSAAADRDKFKYPFDDIVLALVDAYAALSSDRREASRDLLRLFEWLRKAEAIAELGVTEVESEGRVNQPLVDKRQVLLWTQATRE